MRDVEGTQILILQLHQSEETFLKPYRKPKRFAGPNFRGFDEYRETFPWI